MTNVATATSIILQHLFSSKPVAVPLPQALGKVLREDLYADRDFPPFDRVTMDGIALRFDAFQQGQRQFMIQGIQAAGMPRLRLTDPHGCVEVMTGAMLPEGTDTVVRYEDILIENGLASLQSVMVSAGQNIHNQGIDREKGDLLIHAGKIISAAEMGTAATVGKTHLLVSAPPRTAVVSTGDELVEVGECPLPYQIRRSNVFSLQALLAGAGVECTLFHFADQETEIREGMENILRHFDLVILSGAVSAGKFDYVPAVLDSLGVEKLFHQVAQRPGKPFWFGQCAPTATAPDRVVVFALPGNPVSTFLCACRYVLPWLRASMGIEAVAVPVAILANDLTFKPDLTYFVPVKTTNNQGILTASTVVGHGSGDLANLNDADGFVELPRGRDHFLAGEAFPYWGYR